MRILISGATGFLGAAVAKEMAARGCVVAVMTRRALADSRLGAMADKLVAIRGDVFEPASYRMQVQDFAPDALVHCAWGGVASTTRNDLVQLNNVPATGALIDIAAGAGARIVMGIGSQAEYGPCDGPSAETFAPRPTTLYGIAKVAAGQALLQIARERGLRGVWGRVYSLYGPGDDARWLIPSMIRAFQSGETPKVTACEQVWEFLHVSDAARAIASLLDRDSASGLFNIGSGEPVRLRDVILRLRDLVAPEITPLFGAVPYRADQVMHLEANISRLRTATGWKPLVSLDAGLEGTVTAFTAKESAP
jgi:nucleoside-diphosphate-sugar epimerase